MSYFEKFSKYLQLYPGSEAMESVLKLARQVCFLYLFLLQMSFY